MNCFLHIEIDQAPRGTGTETRHAALQSAPPKGGTGSGGTAGGVEAYGGFLEMGFSQ